MRAPCSRVAFFFGKMSNKVKRQKCALTSTALLARLCSTTSFGRVAGAQGRAVVNLGKGGHAGQVALLNLEKQTHREVALVCISSAVVRIVGIHTETFFDDAPSVVLYPMTCALLLMLRTDRLIFVVDL
uniref:Uncharacterized protein n=1 Tax=Parascaris univalens TaxID=6257 RepID=A0A914ZT89_PARUN